LTDFEIETSEYLDSCERSFKEKDYNDILSKLHTIKGNAGTLGIEKIAQLAQSIESDLKQNRYDTIRAGLDSLKEKFNEFQKTALSIKNEEE